MIEFFSSAFVTFLVIIDPPGAAPIFSILTQGANPAQRRSMAIRSALVAWIILMIFGLLGRPLLDTLGIIAADGLLPEVVPTHVERRQMKGLVH